MPVRWRVRTQAFTGLELKQWKGDMKKDEGLSLHEERQLFELAVAGDEKAKEKLISSTFVNLKSNLDSLHFWGKRLSEWKSFPGLGIDCQDLEHMALEVLCKNWMNWEGRSNASFKTWAFRVFRNSLLQSLAKMTGDSNKCPKSAELSELDRGYSVWTQQQDVVDGLIIVEERQMLERFLSRLNSQQQAIIRMRFGLGMREHTMEETAEALGLTYEVIKGRQHRAIDRLRQLMGGVRSAFKHFKIARGPWRRSRKQSKVARLTTEPSQQ